MYPAVVEYRVQIISTLLMFCGFVPSVTGRKVLELLIMIVELFPPFLLNLCLVYCEAILLGSCTFKCNVFSMH